MHKREAVNKDENGTLSLKINDEEEGISFSKGKRENKVLFRLKTGTPHNHEVVIPMNSLVHLSFLSNYYFKF
jgi:hypothetical protein